MFKTEGGICWQQYINVVCSGTGHKLLCLGKFIKAFGPRGGLSPQFQLCAKAVLSELETWLYRFLQSSYFLQILSTNLLSTFNQLTRKHKYD